MPANSSHHLVDFQHYLDLILQNDDIVLAAMYREYYPATEKYVIQNSGTTDDAKDIFQEAFLILWRNIQLKKFIPENRQSLGAYVFSVSKNKWISYLRSAKQRQHVSIEADAAGLLADTGEEQLYIIEIVKNIQKLGGNCRELLTSFYYKKMTMVKIAGQFGWTEATAKNNKYRCLEKLRNLVKDQNHTK